MFCGQWFTRFDKEPSRDVRVRHFRPRLASPATQVGKAPMFRNIRGAAASTSAKPAHLSQKIKPTITLRRLPFDDMESEFKCGRPEGSFHKPHYTQVQISYHLPAKPPNRFTIHVQRQLSLHRLQSLELRPRPQECGGRLRRLRRAVHLPALPQARPASAEATAGKL
jgi:hypothetical protein